MSSTQNARGSAGQPQKRARNEGDEADDHVSKYQAAHTTAAPMRAGGVGIGANSPVAQNVWNGLMAPPPVYPGFGAYPATPAQPHQFLGVPPADPAVFGHNLMQGMISPLQPAAGNIAHLQQQLRNDEPRLTLANAPSAAIRPTQNNGASASISQRAAQQQRVPAVVGTPRYNYQPRSSVANPATRPAVGPPLDTPATQPARAAYGSGAQPTVHHQQYHAGSPAPSQFDLHAQAHQIATSAQAQSDRPNQAEQRFFNNAVHQLQNPLQYVPEIPINYSLPPAGRILLPREILNVRFLSPKQRYLKYTGYCQSMAELYGPYQSLLTQEEKSALTRNLVDNSEFFRDAENRQLQQWKNKGVLQQALEDRARAFALADLGLGPPNVPQAPMHGAAAGTTQQNPQGYAPPIYMPNINSSSLQTLGGGQNGYLSPGLDAGEALAFSQPGSNPRVPSASNRSWHSANGIAPQTYPSSLGYPAPPTHFHQQSRASNEGSSSAPVLIDDKDEPAPVVVSQQSAGLNPTLKRGPSDLEARPTKIARTAAYGRPIDPTRDNDAASAPSPVLPGSAQEPSPASQSTTPSQSAPPARKTFENSEGTKEFETWAKQWEEDKKIVDGRLPGHLDLRLKNRKNRGDFKYKSSWLAFIAYGKREWEEGDKAKREANDKKAKLKARREKEAAKKRAAGAEDQTQDGTVPVKKTKKDERRAQWLARREKAKQEREGREAAARQDRKKRGAAFRQEQEEREALPTQDVEDSTQEQDDLAQAIYDALANSEQFPEDNVQDVTQPSVEPGAPATTETESHEFDDLFEEAEETLVSPDGTSTEATSGGDEDYDELSSLFGDEGDDTEAPVTPPDVSEKASEVDRMGGPESELVERGESGTYLPHKDDTEDPTAKDRRVEHKDSSCSSDTEEEDRGLASKRAEMRALDKQIAERTAQLCNTPNVLFKKRVQMSMDTLIAEKQALEKQIRRLVDEKLMAEVENEGGL